MWFLSLDGRCYVKMITFARKFPVTNRCIGVQPICKLYSQINVYKFGSY